jgi:hypothetical protein
MNSTPRLSTRIDSDHSVRPTRPAVYLEGLNVSIFANPPPKFPCGKFPESFNFEGGGGSPKFVADTHINPNPKFLQLILGLCRNSTCVTHTHLFDLMTEASTMTAIDFAAILINFGFTDNTTDCILEQGLKADSLGQMSQTGFTTLSRPPLTRTWSSSGASLRGDDRRQEMKTLRMGS